jgi:hypothetical protein
MANSTKKSSTTRTKSSAAATKRPATGQRTRRQAAARDDLSFRKVVALSQEVVARSKETIDNSVGVLERQLSRVPHLDLGGEADRLRAEVERMHRTGITVPLVGLRLPVPPPEALTFYGGLAALAAIDLVDWPLAVVIAIGHELARSRRPGVRGLAESVESA